MGRGFSVAVCGATGAVGRCMLEVLEQRSFPVARLKLLASERSAGSTLVFMGESLKVEKLEQRSFDGIDIALFSAGGAVSREFAPIAAKAGAVVVDNTSAFRMEPDVPLVVPEVNPEALEGFSARNIIANPNCSTIQMVVVLKPLHDAAGLKRVVVSTYQSVSGAGHRGIEQLRQQAARVLDGKRPDAGVFARPIAFDCVPLIGALESDGYCTEERKMMHETRKILGLPHLRITATTVRVPVFVGHSEALNVELVKPLGPEEASEILEKAPGVKVCAGDAFPTAADAAGQDETLVGRIRKDESVESGLAMWVVADNLRKGAATNAVQIAQILADKYL